MSHGEHYQAIHSILYCAYNHSYTCNFYNRLYRHLIKNWRIGRRRQSLLKSGNGFIVKEDGRVVCS